MMSVFIQRIDSLERYYGKESTMKRRITATALTAVLLLVSLASCAGKTPDTLPSSADGENVPADDVQNAAVPEEEEEERLSSSVPADLDLGGMEIRALCFAAREGFTVAAEELNGETLNDAIYTANRQTEEELNFSYRFLENGGIETTDLENAFAAGDDSWELVYGTQWKVAQLVPRHMLANLNPAAGGYIDLEKPWWYDGYIGECEADGEHTFLLAGDAAPSVFRRSTMLVMNTDLLRDMDGDVNEVYDTVLSGDWTVDRFSDMVSRGYRDLNGDGSRDTDDAYGFATWTSSDLDHFMAASGVRGCSRDAEGVPFITFNNERTVKFVELFNDFFWSNPGTYYAENAPTTEMFSAGNILFLCEKFDRLDLIRDVQADYTVIPLPKLDESVPAYGSLVHDDAHILCVPAVCQSIIPATAVMEKMAYHYYYDVMPRYYEIILKSKYRRDSSEAASRIIDIIHDGMTTDFAYIYNYGLSNMMCSVRDLIGISKSSDFASEFARNEKAYNKTFGKLVAAIREEG